MVLEEESGHEDPSLTCSALARMPHNMDRFGGLKSMWGFSGHPPPHSFHFIRANTL